MMYWQEEIETMNRSDLEELQLKRLKKTIESAKNSSHYGKLFSELNITSENIHSLDDLRKIPFTTKDDLRNCPELEYWFLMSYQVEYSSFLLKRFLQVH